MKLVKQEPEISKYIQEILRLDCQSLPTRVEGSISDAQNARQNKVASVAMIRALLVTFSNLHTNLLAISRITNLEQIFDQRRKLTRTVLPGALMAVQYCQTILALKGATNTPIATKLANLANGVCDLEEVLQNLIAISHQFHDIKYTIIGGIAKFIKRPEFAETDVGPLKFSLEVSLPIALEAYTKVAQSHFPDSISVLERLRCNVASMAKQRLSALEEETQSAERVSTKELQMPRVDSPCRPKILPIRGVKYCQPLTTFHKRIPSLRDQQNDETAEEDKKETMGEQQRNPSLQQSISSASTSTRTISRPTAVHSKTGFAAAPKPSSWPSSSRPPSRTASGSASVSSSLPRVPSHASSPRSSPSTSPALSTSSFSSTSAFAPVLGERKPSNTRLKPPTFIENRKVMQPQLPSNTNSQTEREKRIPLRSVSSKIFRPSTINPRRSTADLTTKTPRTSRSFKRASPSSHRMNSSFSSLYSENSQLLLSSPNSSVVEETPLTRKSAYGQGNSGPPPYMNDSSFSSSLHIPRSRRLTNFR